MRTVPRFGAAVEEGSTPPRRTAKAEDHPMTNTILAYTRALPPWGLPVAIVVVLVAVVVTVIMVLKRNK
jgi:hypothetical protein